MAERATSSSVPRRQRAAPHDRAGVPSQALEVTPPKGGGRRALPRAEDADHHRDGACGIGGHRRPPRVRVRGIKTPARSYSEAPRRPSLGTVGPKNSPARYTNRPSHPIHLSGGRRIAMPSAGNRPWPAIPLRLERPTTRGEGDEGEARDAKGARSGPRAPDGVSSGLGGGPPVPRTCDVPPPGRSGGATGLTSRPDHPAGDRRRHRAGGRRAAALTTTAGHPVGHRAAARLFPHPGVPIAARADGPARARGVGRRADPPGVDHGRAGGPRPGEGCLVLHRPGGSRGWRRGGIARGAGTCSIPW